MSKVNYYAGLWQDHNQDLQKKVKRLQGRLATFARVDDEGVTVGNRLILEKELDELETVIKEIRETTSLILDKGIWEIED